MLVGEPHCEEDSTCLRPECPNVAIGGSDIL